jgi:hypothetical protein
MSEFLVVVPQGWTQFSWDEAFSHPLMNPDAVAMWAQSGQLPYMSELLIEAGLLQPGQVVMDVKMIDNTYFFVLLG